MEELTFREVNSVTITQLIWGEARISIQARQYWSLPINPEVAASFPSASVSESYSETRSRRYLDLGGMN